MKCQHCEKPATFHITELTGPQIEELHLCENHAREYLTDNQPTPKAAPTLGGVLAQQLKVGQTAEELARLDQQACPMCGITFYEFRHVGRLGCPHDYECFRNELEPLLANIHGETTHKGKRPKHIPVGSTRQADLVKLKREMQEAIKQERYERASEIRDQIRRLEQDKEES